MEEKPTSSSSNSFKALVKKYANKSSIKGLSKILSSERPWQKILWIFTVLVGAAVCSYQLYLILVSFLTYATAVRYEKTTDYAPFPDVSICNLNPDWTPEAAADFPYTYNEYMKLVEKTQDSLKNNDTDDYVTLEQILDAAGYFQNLNYQFLDEVKEKFILETSVYGYETGFTFDETYTKATVVNGFGLCYTLKAYLNKDGSSFDDNPWSLSFVLFLNDIEQNVIDSVPYAGGSYTRGVRILIHNQGTYPYMHNGVTLSPGNEVSMKIKASKVNKLPHPHGVCAHHQNLSQDFVYTWDSCSDNCIQQKVIEDCQCLDWFYLFLPEEAESYPNCGKWDFDDISKTIENLQCGNKAVEKVYDTCACPESCQYYEYEHEFTEAPWPDEIHQLSTYNYFILGTSFEDAFSEYEDIEETMESDKQLGFEQLRSKDLLRRNLLHVKVEITPYNTVVFTEYLLLPPVALFGAIGGILNLWVGISFVTLMELIEFCFAGLLKLQFRRKNTVTELSKRHQAFA